MQPGDKRAGTHWILGLLMLLTSSLSLAVPAAEPKEDQAAHQARLEQLKKEIKELESRIRRDESRRSQEEKALRQVEDRIQKAAKSLSDLKQEQQALRQHLAELETEQQQIRESLSRQQGLLSEQVRASYTMGREQGLKLLLNAQDPLQLQRMLTYYQHLNLARSEQIDGYRDATKRLAQLRTLILDKSQQLENNGKRVEQAKARLEDERRQRNQTIAALQSQLKSHQGSLARKRENQAQLEQLLKELERAVAQINLSDNAKPFSSLKRQLPWPAQGSLAQRFGSRFSNGITSTGIVIKSDMNRPVRAIHHGRVVFANRLDGFGMLLILDHSDGYMSVYGFNQALLKEPGDWVNQGETIALSGDSGGQSQPGLYFEIRRHGKPDNPLKWLKK